MIILPLRIQHECAKGNIVLTIIMKSKYLHLYSYDGTSITRIGWGEIKFELSEIRLIEVRVTEVPLYM